MNESRTIDPCIVCGGSGYTNLDTGPGRVPCPSCTGPLKDFRTSNPLVERLRKDASGFKFVGPSVTADLECEAADEIERLTAQRDDWKRATTVGVDAYKVLLAERDRLVHDIERHIAIASEHATENERLRAALERIQTIYQLTHVHECARVALAGAPDETATAPKVKHETWCASNHLECDCGADSQ